MLYHLVEKFNNTFNDYSLEASNCTSDINNPAIHSITFTDRMAENSPQEYVDFLSQINLHPNTFYFNFACILYSSCLSKKVFQAIPSHINTLEVSVKPLDESHFYGESHPMQLRLPKGITAAQNISRLIINYPARLADNPKNLDNFLADIEALTSLMPNLHEIYFVATRCHHTPDEQIKQTEAKILEHLSFDSLKTCRFYRVDMITDRLEATYEPGLNMEAVYPAATALVKQGLPSATIHKTLEYLGAIDPKVRPDESHELLDEKLKKAEERKPCVTYGLLKEHSLFNRSVAHHASAEAQHEHDMRFGLVPTS